MDPEAEAGLIGAIADILDPHLAAAIGHAMCYVIEDDSSEEWRVLINPDLHAAAVNFYEAAASLASTHPNVAVEENHGDDTALST